MTVVFCMFHILANISTFSIIFHLQRQMFKYGRSYHIYVSLLIFNVFSITNCVSAVSVLFFKTNCVLITKNDIEHDIEWMCLTLNFFTISINIYYIKIS